MLTEKIKKTIQESYTHFLESKGHKARYGQKLMIAEIAKALGAIKMDGDGERISDPAVSVIEAGTGTGKTVAYTLAAIPVAKALDKKLVISTATIALQEQIVFKDLPDILRHSGLSFSFALAKGRGRYVCLSKLDNLLQQGQEFQQHLELFSQDLPDLDEDNLSLYEELVDCLGTGEWDGDRDNWQTTIEDRTWRAVTTDHTQCTGRRCANVSQCSFIKAREDIHKVDVIVTNHDLVLSDLALGGGAILPDPKETIYVFDEGHHLHEKALNHFSQYSRIQGSIRWLDQCKKGLENFSNEVSLNANIKRYLKSLPPAIDELKGYLGSAFPLVESLTDFEGQSEADAKGYSYRPTHRFPLGYIPEALSDIARELHACFNRVTTLIGSITDELEEAMDDEYSDIDKYEAENWYPVIGAMGGRAQGNVALWAQYMLNDTAGDIPQARWVSLVDNAGYVDYELSCSPILAAKTLQDVLWDKSFAALLTSATMTALGRFDRLAMRAGTPESTGYHIVPSPFDYANAGILSIPKMNCEPSDAQAHTDALIDCLPELLDLETGSLVLYSSRRQMQNVYEGLDASMRELILMQGDQPKQEMLKEHRRRIDKGMGSILFGLASFAEGVDLPGGYCTHVVIAKIPFAVPDDPVDSALAEWIESSGGNAFMEISVPDAAIKLVQASGRLLRSEGDTGRITLLDRRIMTKRYGKMLLDALPPYKREVA